MRRKKLRLVDNGGEHGVADHSGSKRTYRLSLHHPQTTKNDVEEPDGYLTEIEQTIPSAVFDDLYRVHVMGDSPSDLAQERGTHRATEGRRLKRLAEEAKPSMLAVIADRAIKKGTDDFTISPQSGCLLRGIDQWAVSVADLEWQFNRVPTLDEIRG